MYEVSEVCGLPGSTKVMVKLLHPGNGLLGPLLATFGYKVTKDEYNHGAIRN